MKYKISQGTIEIGVPSEVKNIGIKHSGGLDSTLILYMLALYKRDERPDVELIPMTVIASTKPFQWMYAHMSQKKIEELTGIKFKKHYVRAADSRMEIEVDDIYDSNVDVVATELKNYLYDNNIIDTHFYGVTLNPPLDAFSTSGQRAPDRDKLLTNEKYPVYYPSKKKGQFGVYQPLANIDKKGVCELYNKLGVLDELFPLTHSCENYNEHTLMQFDLSKHCGLSCCWWCQERLWGFGKLDALTDEQIKPSMD